MERQVDLAEYIFLRLAQLGAGSVHGVPGDYNLTTCDYVSRTGLRWVGNANELSAGYAADGYARVKGIGVLMTSFGVGELSTINAIAGAYAEKVPVVHLVGTPPRTAQKAGACIHHSLGDGNFRVFADMYKAVTVAQADLSDPETAARLVDRTLQQCIRHSRPVYLTLPLDMALVKVTFPATSISLGPSNYCETTENQVLEAIIANLQCAKRPLLLVDGFTARFGVRKEVNELVELTGIPTLTTPFGNGLVNSSLPNYHGIYSGLTGPASHSSWVQSCDLILRFGPLDSDVNTFASTALPDTRVTTILEEDLVLFGEKLIRKSVDKGNLSIKSLLPTLIARLRLLQLPQPEPFPQDVDKPQEVLEKLPSQPDESIIDQFGFWLRMSEFLRPNDYILTETGTSSYGGQSLILPDNTTVINSSLWLSIGYTMAATQGVCLAQRELSEAGSLSQGRTILFEGEGSVQMTAQAISDMVRNKLDVTIFVLNNSGYTIERFIHGFDEGYNDIQPWRHLEAPSYFGAPMDDAQYPVRTRRAANWGELRSALQDPDLQEGKGLTMVEVIMNAGDCPTSLSTFIDFLTKKYKAGW